MNRKHAAAFLMWTLLGVFFATQTYVSYGYTRRPISWGRALALALAEWYLWALLSIVILWLARKLPFDRRRWLRAVALHLPASIIFSGVHLNLYSAVAAQVMSTPQRQVTMKDISNAFAPTKIHLGILTYWIIVGAGHGIGYYRTMRERELRASQLEARLAEARLQMLKMQLHPHFLFNTLHAISALMHRDVEAADRMLAQLSDLLRITLEDSNVQEVTLQRELEFLDRYLAIEKTRFAGRLRVDMEIDPAARDALLPSLLLQPLVENAVRYAIAPRPSPGTIIIRASRLDGRLRIQIEDDGAGLPVDHHEGLGLSNTRARLAQLYDSGHSMAVENRPEGGARVQLDLPFRTELSS